MSSMGCVWIFSGIVQYALFLSDLFGALGESKSVYTMKKSMI